MFALICMLLAGIGIGYSITLYATRCKHHYNIIETIPVNVVNNNNKNIGRYYQYILQCKKCGNIKVKKTN